jgi:hypothetical protein
VSTGAQFVKFDPSAEFVVAGLGDFADIIRGFEASQEPHFVASDIETTEGVVSLQMALTRRSGTAECPVFDGYFANGNELGRLRLTLVKTATCEPAVHRVSRATYGHIIPEVDLAVEKCENVNDLIRGMARSKSGVRFVTEVKVASRYGEATTQFVPIYRSTSEGGMRFEGFYANGNQLGAAYLTITGAGARFETKERVDIWA